jgi:hypothetical protein
VVGSSVVLLLISGALLLGRRASGWRVAGGAAGVGTLITYALVAG